MKAGKGIREDRGCGQAFDLVFTRQTVTKGGGREGAAYLDYVSI